MKGFTKGKGKGKKFIPTSRKSQTLSKDDMKKFDETKGRVQVANNKVAQDLRKKKSVDKKVPEDIQLKAFDVSETYMYPDGNSDFESNHVGTIYAKDWDDAEKVAIKYLDLNEKDVTGVGADMGEHIEGFEFETLYYNAETGNEITESEADKLVDKEGDDAVSHTVHGFELEFDEDFVEDDSGQKPPNNIYNLGMLTKHDDRYYLINEDDLGNIAVDEYEQDEDGSFAHERTVTFAQGEDAEMLSNDAGAKKDPSDFLDEEKIIKYLDSAGALQEQ